jgi:hypothetical protein
MKPIFFLILILILFNCKQSEDNNTIVNNSNSIKKPIEKKKNLKEIVNLKNDSLKKILGFEKATSFKLKDTISIDLNGDNFKDKVYFVKNEKTSGIVIIHGKTNEEIKIGFGKQFAHLKDFNWVDYWGIIEDKETKETIFLENGDVLGEKNVKLQNPSIFIGNEELGGGLITFLNGKYLWIHHTC